MAKSAFGRLFGLMAALSFLYVTVYAQDLNAVVDANNQFTFDLYAKYKSKAGNIFFSPYSISSAIAMTYEGAKGQTADQIQSVFNFPKDDTIRREGFLGINTQINSPDKKYKLSVANALWVEKSYKLLDEYLNIVDKYYGAKAENMDFINNAEASRIKINSWVEEKTNDKIKNLLSPQDITPATALVLTNAIYFKGFWSKQFSKTGTKEEDFRTSPDSRIKVQMMCLTGKEAEFNYGETDKLQILELPYEGNELSMLILLPKNDDLKSLEESLSYNNLHEWKKLLFEQRVDVYLPRFKFETKYFMAEDLEQMGMPLAFSRGADFSGMSGIKDLFISKVIHQAFVEVNEEGTEAAAATAVMMEKGLVVAPEPIPVFKADHPFIFIIQDNATGNILFIGRVSDPAK